MLTFTERLGLSAVVTGVAYVGVYLLKRGKPAGWTRQWITFHLGPRIFRGGPAHR